MKNLDIRRAIVEARLHYYEVAEYLQITDSTFSKWLRKEMPTEKKEKILQAISEIVGEK